MGADRPALWVCWLALAEWWYNTTHHSAIGMTLVQDLYGFLPPLHVPYILCDSKVVDVDDMLRAREDMSRLLKQRLLRAIN